MPLSRGKLKETLTSFAIAACSRSAKKKNKTSFFIPSIPCGQVFKYFPLLITIVAKTAIVLSDGHFQNIRERKQCENAQGLDEEEPSHYSLSQRARHFRACCSKARAHSGRGWLY